MRNLPDIFPGAVPGLCSAWTCGGGDWVVAEGLTGFFLSPIPRALFGGLRAWLGEATLCGEPLLVAARGGGVLCERGTLPPCLFCLLPLLLGLPLFFRPLPNRSASMSSRPWNFNRWKDVQFINLGRSFIWTLLYYSCSLSLSHACPQMHTHAHPLTHSNRFSQSVNICLWYIWIFTILCHSCQTAVEIIILSTARN